MSFLKSAVNQVGRDLGKVVSNQVFKDAHSTPYRRVGSSQQSERRTTEVRSEFDKAISFQMGHRPDTLVNKLAGVYAIIKKELKTSLDDGYLDPYEGEMFFHMIEEFNEKIEDMADILELDTEKNASQINQVYQLAKKTNILFTESLVVASEGSNKERIYNEGISEQLSATTHSFGKYFLLCFVWMKNYARTGKKDMVKTVFANIGSILFSGIPYIVSAFNGLFGYSSYKQESNQLITNYKKKSYIEGQRSQLYLDIADDLKGRFND